MCVHSVSHRAPLGTTGLDATRLITMDINSKGSLRFLIFIYLLFIYLYYYYITERKLQSTGSFDWLRCCTAWWSDWPGVRLVFAVVDSFT